MGSGIRGHLLTPTGLPRAGTLLAISGALFLASTAAVYFTGGTAYTWPYLILIPVFLCAAGFGVWGGLIGGLVGGLLLGPFMPLNVDAGIMQPTSNWIARVCFYVGLGGFVGWLFSHLRQAAPARTGAYRYRNGAGEPGRARRGSRVERGQRQTRLRAAGGRRGIAPRG